VREGGVNVEVVIHMHVRKSKKNRTELCGLN